MAEARKPRAAKPKAEVKVEATVPADVEQFIKEVEADAQIAVAEAEAEYEVLKGKSVDELRQLRQDALLAEAKAKTELYNLRQRVANMATNVTHAVDEDIRAAMTKVEEAGNWLKAIEVKLAGELKDIWGTYF